MDRVMNCLIKESDWTNLDGSKIKIRTIVLDEKNPYTYFDPSGWDIETMGFPPKGYKAVEVKD